MQMLSALLFHLLFGGMLATSPAPLADPRYCPVGGAGHVAYVRRFFSAEETRPLREQFGLLAVSPGDIRLLTDARDSATCQRMAQAVTLDQTGPYPKIWRGFKAGDFYIMSVSTDVPPGVMRHGGGSGLIVLNAEFEVIGAAS